MFAKLHATANCWLWINADVQGYTDCIAGYRGVFAPHHNSLPLHQKCLYIFLILNIHQLYSH